MFINGGLGSFDFIRCLYYACINHNKFECMRTPTFLENH
nr:hypothetical protein B11C_150015 [Bartonella sp. 1-1C]